MDIKTLNKKINTCKKCNLWKTRIKAVPGEGPSKAKLMLIGECPGAEENKIGKPFIGRAGKFLNQLLTKNKINRKKVFITSVLKCYSKKTPTQKQIKTCKPYLLKQINIIKPKTIVLLGKTAQKTIGKLTNIRIIKTYHPAAGMRFPKVRKKILQDFKKIKKR